MRLLIITQKVDKNDPVLGFMHRWLEEFNKNFEKVTIICLEKGEHNLPNKIFPLGKRKLKALFNFYKYIWQERNNYDAVFVHMNQEYVLLAGDIWWLLGKKVYLWRNHAKGNMLTDLAVFLSDKVFCTSPSSYTAKFKKTVLMPVGIDTDFFKPDPNISRAPNSVLFLGRISPVKKVLEFIDWAETEGSRIVTIAGPILDKEYGEKVKLKIAVRGSEEPSGSRGENSKLKINFIGPVTNEETLKLYQSHEIYANFTPAGSFDKTIIEAAACGCKLEVRNPAAKNLNVEDHSLQLLMKKIKMEIS
ncbi:MAG: hypothetical protein A3A26_02605 [Candidatus Zambryskibacteria bacterium RIFCSPLOWO2_01_FULL_47_14]|uniref:Glycosyl transferase family 1 domain-containing protein n=2 Tax=Candidatus Zambryskiibacteriota TaxID=1817925 RepID=A0A1G2U6U4_9BACT|nr:MAG: hypothetical protein A3A26_02605 [Candidatus Zambryskibacteria bacterium RIFCSPLOWO2_01_FULL_47_14]